ncbi:MAG: HAD-IA family hydrolase [Clostridiales bacterium]|nr:HAD-IA family hydrolase [Clostridiales bacterium]
MKDRAVIFDLDGTLLNTLDDLTAAVNHALNGSGTLDVPCVRKLVGNGVPKLISRALNVVAGRTPDSADRPDGFDECLKSFTEYYNVHSADMTAPYDGVAELLREVKNRGARTAIVTNKYDGAAQKLKERFFKTVDIVIGATPDIRPKPAPDGTLKAIAALGVDKAKCVYVGDGETDVATAKNCGIPVVAVTWGFRDREELEPLAPDYIIDSPTELVQTLEKAGLI